VEPEPPPPWLASVPNFLTVVRLLLAAAFPFVPAGWRLALVIAAGASDGLDGWAARRLGATSELGRLLDGIADKAFVLSAVVGVVVAGDAPWWAGLLVMSRDVVVGAIAALCALRRAWWASRAMKPRFLGKATTALAFLWLASLLLSVPADVRWATLALAALTSLGAAVDYARQAAAQGIRPAGSPPPAPPG
jgi:CDP-diacylglycerol--glycerol-3-phosphate 3-phosphatidyltransferase/cardiolipin synthase